MRKIRRQRSENRRQKDIKITFLAIAILLLTNNALAQEAATTAADEKEKAKNPYANDFGPEKIDVSNYPAELKTSYELFTKRCSQCHTIARPINSQFLELSADELTKAKTETPDVLENSLVWQTEEGIWERYVKRMMRKPGCEMQTDEAKSIWKFLVYDSKERKLGTNKANWESARKKLLDDFRSKNPARYKELYEETK